MKYLCLTLTAFVLSVSSIFAQKEVAVLNTDYKSTFYNKKESLSISNEKTGELIVLVEDLEKTNLFLLDKDFSVQKKLETPSLMASFKSFLGYSISDDNTVIIFFSNNSKKKFGTLSFNFEKEYVKQEKLELKFKKEKVIDGISNQNEFYILTGSSTSKFINFYHYQTLNKTFKKHQISFEEATFKTADGYLKGPLSLMRSGGFSAQNLLEKIDVESPNAIETTAEKSKLYQIDDELIFSFDHKQKETEYIIINTNDFSKKTKKFENPILDNSTSESVNFQHHNSFLYKGVVYQMKISSKQMKFTAKQFGSKQLLKEITLNKSDSITFKNGPIIQEGGASPMVSDRIRKLEKTAKFLRKVSQGETGISVFEYDNLLQIKIGSYKEIKSGGAPMMMPGGGFGGMPLGVVGPLSVSFNPTFAAYGNHKTSKSTHIDCVFDKQFNHVDTLPFKSIFDKIDNYEKNKKVKLKNIFHHNKKTYFSYLNTKDKQYHIVEFKE